MHMLQHDAMLTIQIETDNSKLPPGRGCSTPAPRRSHSSLRFLAPAVTDTPPPALTAVVDLVAVLPEHAEISSS